MITNLKAVKIDAVIKLAEVHAFRIKLALDRLSNLFPVKAEIIFTLPEHEFLLIELLTSRFVKLQDYMGAKLFEVFLEAVGEQPQNMTMIDKVNKLEKIGVIGDASVWIAMRELRNHLSHEYPDDPLATAGYLNQLYTLAPNLLIYLDNIKLKLQ